MVVEMPQEDPAAKNHNEGNIGEMRRPSAIEMSIQKFSRKIFELEVFERIFHDTKLKLCDKKKEVEDEKRALDELQYQRLNNMENFCDKIWKFSSENDLCSVFNKYLTTPKGISQKSLTFECERDPEILKVKREMEEIKKKLIDKNSSRLSLEEQLLVAQIDLQMVESYREKNPEIIRLKKDIAESRENLQALNSKIAIIEKEIIERRNSSISQVRDKKCNFVTAAELIAKSDENDTIKRPKFFVKKESAISRKMAIKRETNRWD